MLCNIKVLYSPCLRAEVLPLEDEVPVEAAPEVGAGADVLEVVHGDDVDDGAHHARRVLGHALKHRLLGKEKGGDRD